MRNYNEYLIIYDPIIGYNNNFFNLLRKGFKIYYLMHN